MKRLENNLPGILTFPKTIPGEVNPIRAGSGAEGKLADNSLLNDQRTWNEREKRV